MYATRLRHREFILGAGWENRTLDWRLEISNFAIKLIPHVKQVHLWLLDITPGALSLLPIL